MQVFGFIYIVVVQRLLGMCNLRDGNGVVLMRWSGYPVPNVFYLFGELDLFVQGWMG